MKCQKTPKPTAEEVFRQAAESRLGLDFDYKLIRDRLDVGGIAQRAVVRRRALRARQAPSPVTPYKRRPALAVFLTAFLLLASVGVGGMMVAHLANRPSPPPVDTAGTTSLFEFPPSAETHFPTEDPHFLENDTLTWKGVTYVRTNVLLTSEQVADKLGEVIPADPQVEAAYPERCHDNKAEATVLDEVAPFYMVDDCDENLCVAVQTHEGFALYMVPGDQNTDTHT